MQVAQLTDGQHLETEVLQALVTALGRLRSGMSGERCFRCLESSQCPQMGTRVRRCPAQQGQMGLCAGMGSGSFICCALNLLVGAAVGSGIPAGAAEQGSPSEEEAGGASGEEEEAAGPDAARSPLQGALLTCRSLRAFVCEV